MIVVHRRNAKATMVASNVYLCDRVESLGRRVSAYLFCDEQQLVSQCTYVQTHCSKFDAPKSISVVLGGQIPSDRTLSISHTRPIINARAVYTRHSCASTRQPPALRISPSSPPLPRRPGGAPRRQQPAKQGLVAPHPIAYAHPQPHRRRPLLPRSSLPKTRWKKLSAASTKSPPCLLHAGPAR